jgi:protein-S-isoprenylcysteine O-methyltransferase Ste14
VEKYVLLITGWTIYFTLHSALAADKTKLFFKKLLGNVYTGYRITYNLISTIGLLFLLLLNSNIASPQLFNTNNYTRYFSLMLATVGILILKAAFKQYSLKSFLGFKADEFDSFNTQGILKHMRHPIYTGTIFIVIGFVLFIPTLASVISASCIFTYLAIGIYLEEQKLIKKYGEAYMDYKRKVPALIPRFRLPAFR